MTPELAAMTKVLAVWAQEHFDDGAAAAFDRNIGVDRSAEDVVRELLHLIRAGAGSRDTGAVFTAMIDRILGEPSPPASPPER